VPKHVGVLILVMNSILLSAIFGGYIDCKNMRGLNNIKIVFVIREFPFRYSETIPTSRKTFVTKLCKRTAAAWLYQYKVSLSSEE
jgi:hypothetical protein